MTREDALPAMKNLGQPPPRLALFWKLFCFSAIVLIGHFVAYGGAILLRVGTDVSATIWQPILMTGVALLISARFLRAFERQSLRAIGIGFDDAWLRQLTTGLILGAALVVLVWITLVSTGHATWHANEHLLRHVPHLLVAAVISLAVAVSEEVLYRGYGFQVLYLWNRGAALLVTGVLFVAIHLFQPGGASPWVALNMLLGHFFFAAYFLRTRSLWPCIGVHFAWNFTLAFVLGMPISGRRSVASLLRTDVSESILGGREFGPESGLMMTVVFAVATVLVWRLVPRKRPIPRLVDSDTSAAPTTEGEALPRTRNEALVPALTPQLDRFGALDVLRALALFGILTFNIQGFALHDSAAMNPYACSWTDPLNVAVWVVSTALFGRKDLMLFTMLFGAGILMVADRCAAAGRGAMQIHVQRMAALMLVGLVHAYLIWPGDILFAYSVCGLLVFACRRWSARRLIAIGALLFLVPLVLLVVAQVVVPHLREEWQATIWAGYSPGAESVARYYEVYRGSWWSQMSERVPAAIAQQTALLFMAMGWVSAGMMLVGMGLYRLGYITGGASRRSYWRLLSWTLPCAAILTGGGYWLNFREGWRAEFSFLIGRLPAELGAPLMALACLAAAMLLFSRSKEHWLGKAFAAVGRMSLTNYLTQSLIGSFLFYGTGLGWIGQVDRVRQGLIVLVIFAFQLGFSSIWLSRFQFGPVEWLWRSMAYVRRQPMIVRGRVAV